MSTGGGNSELGERWKWTMDIIFGGLLVFGLQTFASQSDHFLEQPTGKVIFTFLAAAGVTGFYLYDVTVHHVLTGPQAYPFKRSWLSAFRFSLDIVMAFLLALVLLPGLEAKPWQATLRILVVASIWHVAAFFWHLLARAEHESKKGSNPLWHLLFPVMYWSAVSVTTEFDRYRHGPFLASLNRPACLGALSVLLLVVAAFRTSLILGLKLDLDKLLERS
ncbi:MAG TPA: hypothetical protein VME20_09155 [Acidimicrobiales bacterium]|nr:hypothetical protein [Acidimicrobiales bacterium]